MKTKNLFTTVLLATMFAQMPADSNALNIRVRKIISNEMSKCPGKNNQPAVPITYYDEAAKTFSITSRVSIPEAVITVIKDGVEISNETMPINRGTVVEYDFSNDKSGMYVITIAVDDRVEYMNQIYVE